jgi:hypothetical protein
MLPLTEHGPTVTLALCVSAALVFQPTAPVAENRFDAAFAQMPAPQKTDQIRMIPITVPPKTVVTERIFVEPPSSIDAPVSAASLVDKPVVRRAIPRKTDDVCYRHKMRKVMIDQYRWKCRK